MAITEIAVATTAEAVAETTAAEAVVAEVSEAVGESMELIETTENVSESLRILSEVESDYLSELNISNEVWNTLTSEEKASKLEYIDKRVRELGLNPSKTDLTEILDSDVKEALEQKRNLEKVEPSEQYINIEGYEKFMEDPEAASSFELGKEKDPNILRNNMYKVQEYLGERNYIIERSNSRAHHIVGSNEFTKVGKIILAKYDIDINDPINGIFLPNDVNSPLKGVIHEGKHISDYFDTVNQRLRMASSREDCLEILQSIKEDIINGELPLYQSAKNVVNY